MDAIAKHENVFDLLNDVDCEDSSWLMGSDKDKASKVSMSEQNQKKQNREKMIKPKIEKSKEMFVPDPRTMRAKPIDLPRHVRRSFIVLKKENPREDNAKSVTVVASNNANQSVNANLIASVPSNNSNQPVNGSCWSGFPAGTVHRNGTDQRRYNGMTADGYYNYSRRNNSRGQNGHSRHFNGRQSNGTGDVESSSSVSGSAVSKAGDGEWQEVRCRRRAGRTKAYGNGDVAEAVNQQSEKNSVNNGVELHSGKNLAGNGVHRAVNDGLRQPEYSSKNPRYGKGYGKNNKKNEKDDKNADKRLMTMTLEEYEGLQKKSDDLPKKKGSENQKVKNTRKAMSLDEFLGRPNVDHSYNAGGDRMNGENKADAVVVADEQSQEEFEVNMNQFPALQKPY